MKKQNIYKFLYLVCAFLILGFCIRLAMDYFAYDAIINSAPFYTYVIIRAVEFVAPSAIIFIVAIILKNKYNK